MSKQKEKVSKYPYPSRFGSHSEMVVREADPVGFAVVCADEYGESTTEASRLDNGLADPHRCSEKRLGKLFAGKKKEEK